MYSNTARGGVLIYTKFNLNATVAPLSDFNTETLWITINPTPNSTLLLATCYRPELPGKDYIERLCSSLDQINDQNVIVVGDFNFRDIDWTDNSAKSESSQIFLNCVDNNFLHQHISTPTRDKYINDLFLCGNRSIIHDVEVEQNFGTSDHKIIKASIRLFVPRVVRTPRKVYQYSRGDYTNMQIKVNSVNWNSLFQKTKSVNQQWFIFKKMYNEILDEYVPSKMLKPGSRCKQPWLSNKLLQRTRKKKRKAKIAYNKSKLHVDKTNLISIEKQYNKDMIAAKQIYEVKLANDTKNNPRKFYNYVKNYTKPKSSIECLIDPVQEVKVTDDKKKAELLNSFFASVMTDEPNTLPLFTDIKTPSSRLCDIEFTIQDIINIMMKLRPYKAVGPDEIHPNILREIPAYATPLYIIFRKSLDTGIIPDDWKNANICALHKKGSKTNPNNYRPVSLTSQVVKILERLILNDIMEFCKKHNILSCHQHGFQPRCSCLTNLLDCFNDWTYIYDQPKVGCDIIYTDFSKAFDSVPHNRLLLKLSKYGLTGKLHQWIKNFLTTRQQRVIVNGASSKWNHVISGVPQGTILGPLLFLLYINDLPAQLDTTMKLFADDAKVYNSISSTADCAHLQRNIDSMIAWTNEWLLKFNKDKCIVLRIRKAIDYAYYMEGQQLKEVTEQKDLGVLVSNDLKPSKHISLICKKANQRLGMIKRCFSNHSYNVIMPLYTSLVRPILENCSTAWSPWLQKDITMLDKVQSRCIKLCDNNIQFESLTQRRLRTDLCEVYKYTHDNYKIPTSTLFTFSSRQSRSNSLKLQKEQNRTELRHKFFSNRIVTTWNKLPDSVVTAPTVQAFKDRLELDASW